MQKFQEKNWTEQQIFTTTVFKVNNESTKNN